MQGHLSTCAQNFRILVGGLLYQLGKLNTQIMSEYPRIMMSHDMNWLDDTQLRPYWFEVSVSLYNQFYSSLMIQLGYSDSV
eukprot:g12128.t1